MTRGVGERLVSDEVRGTEALRALVPEWRPLCERAQSCTPFQYPEWLLPWWTHFGAEHGELRALALRRAADNRLVGFAPLYCRPDGDGARRLALLGTGNSDYVDVLATWGAREATIGATVDYIQNIRDEWDECDLHPLPAASPLRSVRETHSWSVAHSRADVFPSLDLGPGDLDAFVPRRFLAKLRYARRRLERGGGFTAELADRDTAAKAFDDFRALHDARWHARGERGVLADERTRRFHADVVRGMAASGMLRLHLLRVHDRAIAAFYGFACGRTLYFYLGGFDPAFERDSAGSLAILEALHFAASHGQTRLDFLRGGEAYKYRWGAVDHYGYRLTVRHRAPTSEARNIA